MDNQAFIASALVTDDLRLVPSTAALLKADAEARGRLSHLLGAALPAVWPPELFEADDIERTLALADDSASSGWNLWYLVSRRPLAPDGDPRGSVVGIAGFGGPPDAEGIVTLGYSIVPDARRRGFASQATAALIDFAFRDSRTRGVAAETFEALTPSIGVLEKCGFHREGTPQTPGAIRFIRYRPG